jgi:TPP-dependent pyruvate/acetoin dehydrogenase alpha subunit
VYCEEIEKTMTVKSAEEAGENPLVPNAKLRHMYGKMLDARMLEETIAKRAAAKGKKRISTIRGQEAIRVSTTIDLTEHDLISDLGPAAGMGVLLDGDRTSILRGFTRTKSNYEKVLAEAGVNRLLQGASDEEGRLQLALGAALALKTQRQQGIVVAYARRGEMSSTAWRRVLEPAAKLDLPVIFVVLARGGSRKKRAEQAEVCAIARTAGVPGIPVDACDAVALYRVIQESLGRTRGGDGPVLIESVSWRVEGRRGVTEDPLQNLKEFLLARKVCSETWFAQMEKTTRGRLLKTSAASKKT